MKEKVIYILVSAFFFVLSLGLLYTNYSDWQYIRHMKETDAYYIKSNADKGLFTISVRYFDEVEHKESYGNIYSAPLDRKLKFESSGTARIYYSDKNKRLYFVGEKHPNISGLIVFSIINVFLFILTGLLIRYIMRIK